MKRVATAQGLDPTTAADEQPYVAPPPQLQQQQLAKRVKMEGEGGDETPATPSAVRSQYAVNVVQQTIDELQQDCQRAFRESRESLARAEAAEERNRTLQIEFDEFKQKTKEAEKRNAKKLDELKREAANREEEAREKVASLTRQLEAKQSQFIQDVLRDGIGGLLRKLPVSLVESERQARESEEELKEKVVSLTHQLEAEQSQVIHDLLRYRIDELTLKLDQDETSQLQLQQSQEMEEGLQPTLEQQLQGNVLHAPMQQQLLPSSQFEKEKEPDEIDMVLISPPWRRRWTPVWETVPHATNLLQVCDPNRAGTIPFYNAFQQLRALYPGEMKKDLRSSGIFRQEINCRACDFQRINIIDHFLSMKHLSEMLESRAAVSLAAFKYWRNKLGQAVNQLEKERRDKMNAEKPNKDHAPVVGKEDRV